MDNETVNRINKFLNLLLFKAGLEKVLKSTPKIYDT